MKPPIVVAELLQGHESVLRAMCKRGVKNLATPSYLLSQETRDYYHDAGGTVVELDELAGSQAKLEARLDARLRANLVLEHLQAHPRAVDPSVSLVSSQELTRVLGAQLEDWLAHSRLMLGVLDLIARDYAPHSVIVSADFSRVQRLMIDWARERGVPSFHLMHGASLGRKYTIYAEVMSDYILAVSARAGEEFLENGLDPDRLIVVGNPRQDSYGSYISRRDDVRKWLRERFGIPADAYVVLFGTTGAPNMTALADYAINNTTTRGFLAGVARLRANGIEALPIIKGRPSVIGRSSEVEKATLTGALREFGFDPVLYVAGEPVEPLVVGADVVVSCDSNLSLEAAIAGVVPLNLWTYQNALLGPFFGLDDGVPETGFGDEVGLAAMLERLLTDRAHARAVVDRVRSRMSSSYHLPDAHAADRAAGVICERAQVRQAVTRGSDGPHEHRDSGFVRHDVLRRVRRDARFVGWFDLSGETARAYERRSGNVALALASSRDDHSDHSILEAARSAQPRLEAIAAIDLLARAADPSGLLIDLRACISPGAQLVATVGNLRNFGVLDSLVAGTFAYPDGAIAGGRRRLFTLPQIHELFAGAGYEVEEIALVDDPRLAHVTFPAEGFFDIVSDRLNLRGASPQEQAELKALEFIVVARALRSLV